MRVRLGWPWALNTSAPTATPRSRARILAPVNAWCAFCQPCFGDVASIQLAVARCLRQNASFAASFAPETLKGVLGLILFGVFHA